MHATLTKPIRDMWEIDRDSKEQVGRPPYLAAALTACAILVLYVRTLAPTTAFWDTSEYITTAHILGIPHPPGNPLFVVRKNLEYSPRSI